MSGAPSAITAMVAPIATRRAVEHEQLRLAAEQATEVTGRHITTDDLTALGHCIDRCHDRDLTHGRWLAWCPVCGYVRPLTTGERA